MAFSYNKYTIENFSQALDHFDLTNSKTFIQRFHHFTDFVKENESYLSTIVYLGYSNNITNEIENIENTTVYELANKTNSSLIIPELRYFANSVPEFENGTVDYTYLTVEQIMEDLAIYLDNFSHQDRICISNGTLTNCTYNITIIAGGLQGTIAAWFKVKYSRFSTFGWISSPILNLENFTDIDEYLTTNINKNTANCYANITKFINDSNLIELTGVTESHNISSAFYLISEFLTDIINFNNSTELNKLCENVDGKFQTTYNKWKKRTKIDPNVFDPLNLESKTNDAKTILYLQCTQLSSFKTAPKFSNQTLTEGYYKSVCKNVFNITYKQIYHADIVKFYGSKYIQTTNTIYTTCGSYPQDRLTTTDYDKVIQRLYFGMDNEPQFCDLKGINENNAESFNKSREIVKIMTKWMTKYCSHNCLGKCMLEQCICPKDWYGDNCEYHMPRELLAFNAFMTFLITVPTIIVGAAGIAAWIIFTKAKLVP